MCLYICLSICLSICLYICLSVYMPVCPSICPSVYLSIYRSTYLSICLSNYLSVYNISIYISVYLCVCLCDCLTIYMPFCLYVYLDGSVYEPTNVMKLHKSLLQGISSRKTRVFPSVHPKCTAVRPVLGVSTMSSKGRPWQVLQRCVSGCPDQIWESFYVLKTGLALDPCVTVLFGVH